jgi:hypothetical protein
VRFDALVEEARSVGDPDRARALLREALGLVRGDPLCDVPAEGRIAQWRRGLEEKCLQALTMRIDADLAAGAAGELVVELESLVAAHAFEERLWRQLMLALYRSGRQADALDAFARARRTFAAELGLEPGEQLARLHAQMLARDASLLVAAGDDGAACDGRRDQSPVAAPKASSSLPAPVTRLVGREPELAVIQALLADRHVRVVTLIGAGGVGKTRLSLELARRIEPGYRDGAVLVRLERLTDPALVAAEIATSLGHRAGTDGPGADGLGRYLRDMELLLVIDNFEHLLGAAVLVSELLELAPQLQVVVSSRTALRIRGERLFTVEPLDLPAGGSDAEIADSPAVQLFVDRARAADPELHVELEGLRMVAAICRALDGLPLAIELAASRCHLLTLAEIHEQLSRPLLIGERSLRDLPDRHQTLRATIGWSYELLSDSAQEMLRAAGVFLGGFTPAALESVLGRTPGGALAEFGSRASFAVRPKRVASSCSSWCVRSHARSAAMQVRSRASTPATAATSRGSWPWPARRSRLARRSVSCPRRCVPITRTSVRRSPTPSNRAIESRPRRWRSACVRCGTRATSGRRAGSSPSVCSGASRFPAPTRWRFCESSPRSSTPREGGSDASPTAQPSWATRRLSGWPQRSCSPKRSRRATATRWIGCVPCSCP